MNHWRMRDVFLATVVLLAAVTVAGVVSLLGIPAAPCARVQQKIVEFTIVADLDGYNGSKLHDGQGPLLSVHTCDTVVVNFTNRDVQAHGLAVDFYAANGLEATGRETVDLQFLAFKTGSFRVFCKTICSVHSYMQHAQLDVVCALGSGC